MPLEWMSQKFLEGGRIRKRRKGGYDEYRNDALIREDADNDDVRLRSSRSVRGPKTVGRSSVTLSFQITESEHIRSKIDWETDQNV